jgi:type II secretory pathway component GspD/PulD (secretin)
MKRIITFIILSLYGFVASSSYAVVVSSPDPEEAQVIEALLDAPDVSMRFQNASLPSVLRALAETAGMPFIGLPRGEAEDIYVDMTVKGNAYSSLEQVAETYGYALVYQKGVWLFRPIQQVQSKLVSKVYKLKHIHLSSVSPDQQAISTSQGKDNSSARPDSINTNVFSTSENKVVEDIKMILSINPGDLSPNVTQTAEVDVPAKAAASSPVGISDMLMGTSPEDIGRKITEKLGTAATNMLVKRDEEAKVPRGAVISNPDHNSVFVVATSAQHEWIEAYLNAIDQPRKLILLETRFIEIRKDPSMDMGVNWESVLSGDYNISITDHDSPDAGSTDTEASSFFFKDNIGGSILSGPELNIALSFLRNFADSRNLQHPSQVTVNNRSVVLRSVRQVPYQGASSTNSNSGSSSTTNNIEYMPIGTTISILPRILDGENIELNLLMNVSDLLGYSNIDDADIPLTSARDYSGEAIVKTGNTLAIAGLEALLESDNETKVPILGDIPFFGYLFKSSSKTQNNFQLIMFVTATIMDGYDGGITPKKDLQEAVDYFDGLDRLDEATKHVDGVLGSPTK